MAAHVEDAAIFVDAVDALHHLRFEHIQFPIGRKRLVAALNGVDGRMMLVVDSVIHLLEDPRPTKGGAADHAGIHTIVLESAAHVFAGRQVAIADDGYVYARIAFDFADQAPIGFALIHLCAGAAVDG